MLKLIFNESHKLEIIETIRALNSEFKWQVEVKRYRKNRSDCQNRLLWLWLGVIGDELGYHKDEMYDVVVDQCWPCGMEEVLFCEKKIVRQRKTSQLNSKEFTVFLNNIDSLSLGLGIILPKPEDVYLEAMLLDKK